MANNYVYANDGQLGDQREGTIGPLVEGQAGVVMAFTLYNLNGAAIDLSGYTVTGKLKNRRSAVVGSITGAMAVTGAAASGEFTWTVDEDDVAEAGPYLIWFTFTKVASPTYTSIPTQFTIIDDEAIGGAFVSAGGVTVEMAAFLAALAALADTDGNFIVGDGSTWVAESGATARSSLGLGTGNTPQFTGLEIGHASDTTLARASAGNLTVEGNALYRAGGTDVAVADGGTGASTAQDAKTNLGLGTGSTPQFSGIEVGHASDTTLARASAGVLSVEGVQVLTVAGGTMTGEVNLADQLLTRGYLKDSAEVVNAIGSIGGGTQDVDLTLGNVVTGTVDTSTTTFTFSNPPATGRAGSFLLILTNGGSQTINWPAAVDWNEASAPTLQSSGVDMLVFLTVDAGTNWFGSHVWTSA